MTRYSQRSRDKPGDSACHQLQRPGQQPQKKDFPCKRPQKMVTETFGLLLDSQVPHPIGPSPSQGDKQSLGYGVRGAVVRRGTSGATKPRKAPASSTTAVAHSADHRVTTASAVGVDPCTSHLPSSARRSAFAPRGKLPPLQFVRSVPLPASQRLTGADGASQPAGTQGSAVGQLCSPQTQSQGQKRASPTQQVKEPQAQGSGHGPSPSGIGSASEMHPALASELQFPTASSSVKASRLSVGPWASHSRQGLGAKLQCATQAQPQAEFTFYVGLGSAGNGAATITTSPQASQQQASSDARAVLGAGGYRDLDPMDITPIRRPLAPADQPGCGTWRNGLLPSPPTPPPQLLPQQQRMDDSSMLISPAVERGRPHGYGYQRYGGGGGGGGGGGHEEGRSRWMEEARGVRRSLGSGEEVLMVCETPHATPEPTQLGITSGMPGDGLGADLGHAPFASIAAEAVSDVWDGQRVVCRAGGREDAPWQTGVRDRDARSLGCGPGVADPCLDLDLQFKLDLDGDPDPDLAQTWQSNNDGEAVVVCATQAELDLTQDERAIAVRMSGSCWLVQPQFALPDPASAAALTRGCRILERRPATAAMLLQTASGEGAAVDCAPPNKPRCDEQPCSPRQGALHHQKRQQQQLRHEQLQEQDREQQKQKTNGLAINGGNGVGSCGALDADGDAWMLTPPPAQRHQLLRHPQLLYGRDNNEGLDSEDGSTDGTDADSDSGGRLDLDTVRAGDRSIPSLRGDVAPLSSSMQDGAASDEPSDGVGKNRDADPDCDLDSSQGEEGPSTQQSLDLDLTQDERALVVRQARVPRQLYPQQQHPGEGPQQDFQRTPEQLLGWQERSRLGPLAQGTEGLDSFQDQLGKRGRQREREALQGRQRAVVLHGDPWAPESDASSQGYDTEYDTDESDGGGCDVTTSDGNWDPEAPGWLDAGGRDDGIRSNCGGSAEARRELRAGSGDSDRTARLPIAAVASTAAAPAQQSMASHGAHHGAVPDGHLGFDPTRTGPVQRVLETPNRGSEPHTGPYTAPADTPAPPPAPQTAPLPATGPPAPHSSSTGGGASSAVLGDSPCSGAGMGNGGPRPMSSRPRGIPVSALFPGVPSLKPPRPSYKEQPASEPPYSSQAAPFPRQQALAPQLHAPLAPHHQARPVPQLARPPLPQKAPPLPQQQAQQQASQQSCVGARAASISATQGATLGEECSPSFWEGGPDLYEVFPFQRQALEFADWANMMTPEALRRMQRAAGVIDFANFNDRWQFVEGWMRSNPAPKSEAEDRQSPPQGQHASDDAATGSAFGPLVGTEGGPGPQDGASSAFTAIGNTSVTTGCSSRSTGSGSAGGDDPVKGGGTGGGVSAGGPAAASSEVAPDPATRANAAPPKRPPTELVRVFVREYRRAPARRGGAWDGGGGGGAGGAYESDYSRHFVVTTYRGIWRRYHGLQSTQRHFYEVIRSDRPCHMYFDIEYSRGANTGADGDALVDRLLGLLGELVRSTWGLELIPRLHVLELESVTEAEAAAAAARTRAAATAFIAAATAVAAAAGTTTTAMDTDMRADLQGTAAAVGGGAGPGAAAPAPATVAMSDKFSRHLVVRLPGVALAGNGVAGGIVARLWAALHEAGLSLLKASEPPGGATACIVDPAVYSRFRHFRMIWCSKGGKEAVLRPTGRYMMAAQAASLSSSSTNGSSSSSAATAVACGSAPSAPSTFYAASALGFGSSAALAGSVTRGSVASGSPLSSHTVFLASLICNVHPEARLLELPPAFLAGIAPLRGVLASGAPHRAELRGAGGLAATTVVFEGNVVHATTRRPIKLTWAEEPADLRENSLAEAAAAEGAVSAAVAEEAQHSVQNAEAVAGVSVAGAAATSAGTATGTALASGPDDSRVIGGSARQGGSRQTALQRIAMSAVPFVEVMATDRANGAEAQVRSIAYCGENGSVTFGMIGPGSHFCDRIGRPHRSNHVFFLLDFLRGTYCQKCYDPECSGWRSEWNALPPEVWQRDRAPVLALATSPGPVPSAAAADVGAAASVSPAVQPGVRPGEAAGTARASADAAAVSAVLAAARGGPAMPNG